jgi:hypothetical protein
MKWVRTVLSAVVGVIAVVALLCSVIGFWARDTIFDESEVAGAVESALDEPGVTDALAVRLTDTVMSAVDLPSVLNSILPEQLQRLTPALVGGATQVVEERLTDRLADPDTRAALVAVFERSYAAFLDVLEGDGLVDGITVEDGEVIVNFLPVIADGLQTLQRVGLLSDVTIPELDRQGDPSQQIAELEQALGRDFDDDFGQVVVYRSDSLASAGETVDRVQQLLILIKRSFYVILAVTVVALVGSVLLAHRRRRAILILLLSSAATFVLARAVVNRVLDDVPSIARTPAGQAAVAASTSALADGLVKAFGVGAVLFLVAAMVTYMLDSESAVRRRIAASTGDPSLTAAVAANRTLVMIVSFGAALLVITLAGFSVLSIVVAVALAALGVFALRAPGQPTPTLPPPGGAPVD